MRLVLALALSAFAMRGRVVERPKDQVFVKEKAGPAYFIPTGSDVWFILKSTRTVEDGTKLRTGKTAALVLEFNTGEARMAEETTLVVESTTTFNLLEGTVLISSGTVRAKENGGQSKTLAAGVELIVTASGTRKDPASGPSRPRAPRRPPPAAKTSP